MMLDYNATLLAPESATTDTIPTRVRTHDSVAESGLLTVERRPRGTPFLTAEWRYLVLLNYEVSPAVLEPLVPLGTTLDLWDGRALISVVGFRFLHTRTLRTAIPFHQNFDEVNLRFYVTRTLPTGEVRRGVAFIREVVPRVAIARIARWMYNEPYVALPMRSRAPAIAVDAPGRITYAWRLGESWQHVGATAVGKPMLPSANSEAAFVLEHYWGYTRQRDGGTIEYAVAHAPWRVWSVVSPSLEVDAEQLYGPAFAPALAGPPRSAFVVDGSPVVVYRPERLNV